MVFHAAKMAVVVVSMVLATGCWNDRTHTIHLGDVSIGQQMIDLQAALEQGAVTQQEYEELKAALMSVESVCNSMESQE